MPANISLEDLGHDYTAGEEDIAQMFVNQPGEGDDVKTPTDKPATTVVQPKGDDDGGTEVELDDDLDDDDQRAVKTQEELEATTPEAQAAAREKKRTDRLNQRQRQRLKIDNLERNLASALATNQEIHQRLAQLENTNVSSHAAAIDNRVTQLNGVEQQLKDIIAEATVKGDGIRVAEATQAMIQLQSERTQTLLARQNLEQQARQPRQQQMLDNETVALAQNFISKNPWYKGPKSDDADSQILATLDNRLTKQGWNPRTPAYWAELETQAKQYLPHRFGKTNMENNDNGADQGHNAEQRRAPKSPVAGGGSNNTVPKKGGETYRVNEQRVRAMKEAGIWDDPVRRQKMIRRYQQADRDAASE